MLVCCSILFALCLAGRFTKAAQHKATQQDATQNIQAARLVLLQVALLKLKLVGLVLTLQRRKEAAAADLNAGLVLQPGQHLVAFRFRVLGGSGRRRVADGLSQAREGKGRFLGSKRVFRLDFGSRFVVAYATVLFAFAFAAAAAAAAAARVDGGGAELVGG